MIRIHLYIVLALLFCTQLVFAQTADSNSTYIYNEDAITVASVTSLHGETMPLVELDEVQVIQPPVFKSDQEKSDFNYLKYCVMKVYDYALVAVETYDSLQVELDDIKRRRKRKKHRKSVGKELKADYKFDIKNLTKKQGEVLVLLINRYSGNNCYDLVKDLNGGFSAMMLQQVAKMNDYSLKEPYKPEEHPHLEYIVAMLESGQWSYPKRRVEGE